MQKVIFCCSLFLNFTKNSGVYSSTEATAAKFRNFGNKWFFNCSSLKRLWDRFLKIVRVCWYKIENLYSFYRQSPGKLKGTTTFSITTHSITTLSIKGLYMTLSINDSQHNWTLTITMLCIMLSFIMLNVSFNLLLCWVSLCWMSLCWVSLCWMSLCWVSWRKLKKLDTLIQKVLLENCLNSSGKSYSVQLTSLC